MQIDRLLERNLIPDCLIRFRIRQLLKDRLKAEMQKDQNDLIKILNTGPIAINVDAANDQHYEVPADFFKKVLGSKMKYSSAYFLSDTDSLDQAEVQMLKLTCGRAALENGQSILELGCGWGSLTLWMAENYPASRILAVSNSNSQREHIESMARRRGLSNIRVMTEDINRLQIEEKFDRIVSVEMFEHMRNIHALFEKISGWMKDDALLFVHIFSHAQLSYLFEDLNENDWMSRYFFIGGMMPSHNLYRNFSNHLKIKNDWKVSGIHYAKTARAWLKNMDSNHEEIMEVFKKVYRAPDLWWERWRIFFMACEELWGWKEGSEWQVSHYLFQKSSVQERIR